MSKLNALFIGNCQNKGLIHYLSHSEEFVNTFNIKSYANWELIDNKESLPVVEIRNSDLFIFQPLPPVHGCYSTDPSVVNSIGYFVKPSCKKISYPYVYCSSLWPIVQAAMRENRWFGGQSIDKLIKSGCTKQDIFQLFLDNKIDWEYESRFNETLTILKNKETLTDIKISDYIEQNIKTDILFLMPQHPTSIVFLELSNRILDKLNMKPLNRSIIKTVNDANLPDSTYELPTNTFPMHKSIANNGGFEYVVNYAYESDSFYLKRIEDYITLNHH